MQVLFLLCIPTVIWGPLIPYLHCIIVPIAYGVLIWLSYLYLDQIRARLEEVGSKELGALAWIFSYLIPFAGVTAWASAYFARLPIGGERIGFFLVPIVLTYLIRKCPPGTRLIASPPSETEPQEA